MLERSAYGAWLDSGALPANIALLLSFSLVEVLLFALNAASVSAALALAFKFKVARATEMA